jgi:hypothetical protein
MALFYFHLCDGTDVLLDPEGRDIPELDQIPAIALREARAIMSHEVLQGSLSLAQAIEVGDESDAVVHRLEFRDALTVSLSPPILTT